MKRTFERTISAALLAFTVAGCNTAAPIATHQSAIVGATPRFSTFESGQVRPLALSPNGKRLYAVNTPDDRLEIFDVGNSGLQYRASLTVGMEPVAVAARTNDEVWVVNHLSDSVSVVDVSNLDQVRVVKTLLVGDEPRDLVFAGPGRARAFVTTAHRGQNSPVDPQLATPGVGRADVWVFDAANLGASLGGTPLSIVTLFTDTPRALAVSPDGTRVYVAGFHTGNQTTAISEPFVPNGGEAAGGLPLPNTNFAGEVQPETSLVVKYRDGHWRDRLDRVWDDKVMFNLPDKDVFVLDATATPPAQVPNGVYTGVGTILFNMAVNPVSGKVYVSNTDAQNDVRFEGPGTFAGSSVRGHLAESRITVLSNGAAVPRHLNKHIDYATCCADLPNDENARSLAFPQGMAVSSDGATLYVAALGSGKVGIFDTAALENDSFVPSTANQVAVSGGGPTGVVLDEKNGRLYVMTRFDNGISAINTATRTETQHLRVYNPEPASVVAGRPFLYNASYTSSHGDSACASCHIFGDFDSLSWDLGNPDGASFPNLNPIIQLVGPFATPTTDVFKSMKGPMNTQSLRGLPNHGPMHWRGDRTGSLTAPNAQPDSGSFDENAAFNAFNVAFEGLVGRRNQLTTAEMQQFTDFQLQVMYPPNPVRNLDNSLTAAQAAGRDHFFKPVTTFGAFGCNDCHRLDPAGNAEFGVSFPGFFGSDGRTSFDASDDPFDGGQTPVKVPHLRNLYQKVGLFGVAPINFLGFLLPGTGFLGDQVRGFGNTHDGSIPLGFFLSGFVFSNLVSPNGFEATIRPEDGAFVPTPAGQQTLDNLFSFLMAFDSNHAPVVGQQITLNSGNGAVAGARVTLLEARAAAGECELVARSGDGGWLFDGLGQFVPDRAAAPPISDAALRSLAGSNRREVTFTCAPIGSGRRLGIDADLDGFLDGDELAAHSNPRDPASTP
jgi:YVTN family beta-propeller protein